MLLYLRVNDVVHVVSVGVRAVSYGIPVFVWQATQGTRFERTTNGSRTRRTGTGTLVLPLVARWFSSGFPSLMFLIGCSCVFPLSSSGCPNLFRVAVLLFSFTYV